MAVDTICSDFGAPKNKVWHCFHCSPSISNEVISVQSSSVTQSCLTLCDPMNCSTPGFPAHHQLPEFTQTQVHRVSDAIQPSHPLSSPFSPAPNPSQHQSLFQWVNLHMRWPKYEVIKFLQKKLFWIIYWTIHISLYLWAQLLEDYCDHLIKSCFLDFLHILKLYIAALALVGVITSAFLTNCLQVEDTFVGPTYTLDFSDLAWEHLLHTPSCSRILLLTALLRYNPCTIEVNHLRVQFNGF